VLSLFGMLSRCHVVLAAQASWEAVATGLFGRLTGKPTMVRLANTGPFGELRQLESANGRTIFSRLFQGNSAFLALSGQAGEELLAFGCQEDRIRRITNGVDVQHFQPPATSDDQRDRTVLFVGRLAEQKDPELLLGSWQRVNSNGNYRLLIAGEGPLAESLEDQIARRQIRNVELLGACHALAQLYHQASVFVLPSRSEGCSNALLEAMASGLCPVVTNIGGNRDVVVDGVNGRLVEPGDADQLSDVLAEVLGNPGLRQRLSAAARDHVVSHHQLRDVADRYLHEFTQLVS
jgi:glycosyltransferase involved in cell wall biosynthesis